MNSVIKCLKFSGLESVFLIRLRGFVWKLWILRACEGFKGFLAWDDAGGLEICYNDEK